MIIKMNICGVCFDTVNDSVTFGELTESKCRCKQIYHKKCLYEWFYVSQKALCPLCKTESKSFKIIHNENTLIRHNLLMNSCFIDRTFNRTIKYFEDVLFCFLNDNNFDSYSFMYQVSSLTIYFVLCIIITIFIIIPYLLFVLFRKSIYELLKDEFIDLNLGV